MLDRLVSCRDVQDFGTKWTNLTEKAGGKVAAFWDFDWGAALTHQDPSKSIDDEVIFATVYEESSAMKGPYPGWDKDLHFVRSDDLWDSEHTKLVACGNQFEVVGQRVSISISHVCSLAPTTVSARAAANHFACSLP